MEIPQETIDKLTAWSGKLGTSIEDLKTEFTAKFQEEIKIHPDLSEKAKIAQAIKMVYITKKGELRSPAIAFKGVVDSVPKPRDMLVKTHETLDLLWKEDKEKAMREGYLNKEGISVAVCSPEGKHVDNREAWKSGKKNPGFGKELKAHSWIINVHGKAFKIEDENQKRKEFDLMMNLKANENGKPIVPSIDILELVDFRAIDKSKSGENKFTLTASKFTEFKKSDQEIDVKGYIESSHGVTPLNEVGEWIAANKGKWNVLCVCRGNAASMKLEANANGNRIIRLDSMELGFDENSSPIICIVPKHIKVNFGVMSEIIVIGSPFRFPDNDDGTAGNVAIMVSGLWADPDFITTPEEVEQIPMLTEEPKEAAEVVDMKPKEAESVGF